jgi:hypothetical protein
MTQTQFIMTGKSTKNMNFSNMKADTRSYKAQKGLKPGTTIVECKVRGRVVGNIVACNDNGTFLHISTAHFVSNKFTPVDIQECVAVAKRSLKVA